MPACARMARQTGLRIDCVASSVQRARMVWRPGWATIAFSSRQSATVVLPERREPSALSAWVVSVRMSHCLPRQRMTTRDSVSVLGTGSAQREELVTLLAVDDRVADDGRGFRRVNCALRDERLEHVGAPARLVEPQHVDRAHRAVGLEAAHK